MQHCSVVDLPVSLPSHEDTSVPQVLKPSTKEQPKIGKFINNPLYNSPLNRIVLAGLSRLFTHKLLDGEKLEAGGPASTASELRLFIAPDGNFRVQDIIDSLQEMARVGLVEEQTAWLGMRSLYKPKNVGRTISMIPPEKQPPRIRID